MRVARIEIENFRGIAKGSLLLSEHTVLVGDNNSGKSTVLEAIDLVLGPERTSRPPVIDEHDFYGGRYLAANKTPIEIKIEVTVVDLAPEAHRRFKDHIEWWDKTAQKLLEGPPAEGTDAPGVVTALRVGFVGRYDADEDDFIGETFFCWPIKNDGTKTPFRSADKRECGFLYLRTLRTGSRALSLERGSLLDIILRLKEIKLQMWEKVLEQLRELAVADDPTLGVNQILTSVQKAVRSFVPSEWADAPQMRVSDLTREHLRKTLTVFMTTGAKDASGKDYAAPFQHQGTGTINTLVLAMLSLIAEAKKNVIFAMEEPETAIPPHTQKRIIKSVRAKSSQAIFTSHSPYVLEEFEPAQILVLKRDGTGTISGVPAAFPAHIKPKAYRTEFRSRFAEALLARRILLAEGFTETDAYPAAARRLHDLAPDRFCSLEGMGIAVFNAETDSQIAPLAKLFQDMGKEVYAVYDKQTNADQKNAIEAILPAGHRFEAMHEGFENLAVTETAETALRRYAASLVSDGLWPRHLGSVKPSETSTIDELRESLRSYLKHNKAAGDAADLLTECCVDEMPTFIRDSLEAITKLVSPPVPTVYEEVTEEEAVVAVTTGVVELEVAGDGFDDLF
ncbi:MAG: AAA family ATPase [Magnetococcales bacterium]|nr:AAA family ATPase [Magnetococcales bacterium]